MKLKLFLRSQSILWWFHTITVRVHAVMWTLRMDFYVLMYCMGFELFPVYLGSSWAVMNEHQHWASVFTAGEYYIENEKYLQKHSTLVCLYNPNGYQRLHRQWVIQELSNLHLHCSIYVYTHIHSSEPLHSPLVVLFLNTFHFFLTFFILQQYNGPGVIWR